MKLVSILNSEWKLVLNTITTHVKNLIYKSIVPVF
jgi:hypothetical protein